ncbi:MAG: prepilin-type N-terminal cleavage/methylation domain-containing protein [Candidatus Thiodiazotropha sp.]
MRQSDSKRDMRGMTLIEVLVAFVILGMVMAVIMRINATSLRNHEVSKAYQHALRVAESRMEAMSVETSSETLQQSGVEAGGLRWEYFRQPYHEWSEERLQGLQAIPVKERIVVAWGEQPFPRQLSFSRIHLIYRGR